MNSSLIYYANEIGDGFSSPQAKVGLLNGTDLGRAEYRGGSQRDAFMKSK